LTEALIFTVFTFTGIVTGIASSMLGIGGGLIFIPVLTLLLPHFNLPTNRLIQIVVATSLFAGSFSSSGAFIQHWRMHNVVFKKALPLLTGSLISAFIVPEFVISLDASVLKILLLVILLSVAVKLLFEKNGEIRISKKLNDIFLFPFGLIVGGISALTGLGGGIIFVPILTFFFAEDIKSAIGTSTLVVAVTMISSAVAYGLLSSGIEVTKGLIGYIHIYSGLLLGMGALIGNFAGARFFKKYPSKIIKKLFAVFIIIIILKSFI